jgi:hypothetical protein
MLVVHVVALVLAIVTVGAGKDLLVARILVAGSTFFFVLAMVATLNRDQSGPAARRPHDS